MSTFRKAVAELASKHRASVQNATPLQKFNFNNSYYNTIGLLKHDIQQHESVEKEAVKRLSREESEKMDFRIARAFHLNGNKQILPKEEWTTMENDVPYLEPYIALIKKEKSDKKDWDYFTNPQVYQ